MPTGIPYDLQQIMMALAPKVMDFQVVANWDTVMEWRRFWDRKFHKEYFYYLNMSFVNEKPIDPRHKLVVMIPELSRTMLYGYCKKMTGYDGNPKDELLDSSVISMRNATRQSGAYGIWVMDWRKTYAQGGIIRLPITLEECLALEAMTSNGFRQTEFPETGVVCELSKFADGEDVLVQRAWPSGHLKIYEHRSAPRPAVENCN